MPTVSDVCSCLNQIAPPELSESWDNTGLLLGRQTSEVSRLLTCLTVTSDVVNEAVTEKVQMIVSHHPVLFRGTKQISDRNIEGGMLLQLIEAGIAVYSPHTAFDSAATGINQQLAEKFGLKEVQPLLPHQTLEGTGAGRLGRLLEPMLLADFLKVISTSVGTSFLQFCGNPQALVHQIGIGCGAAEGFLSDGVRLGCDTFVTGEARFHTVLDARDRGINLVLTGHYCSERPAVEFLAQALSVHFPQISCFASRVERDPLSFYCPK